MAYSHDVYRLTLKRWGSPPHFAEAYYDEKTKTLFLSAMTDMGFDQLIKALNGTGLDLSSEPYVRVNPMMIKVASDILGRKIDVLKYSHLFKEDIPPEKQEKLDNLNLLMQLALPDINAGKEPDYVSIAAKTGMDPETARDFLRQISEKLNNMKPPKKR